MVELMLVLVPEDRSRVIGTKCEDRSCRLEMASATAFLGPRPLIPRPVDALALVPLMFPVPDPEFLDTPMLGPGLARGLWSFVPSIWNRGYVSVEVLLLLLLLLLSRYVRR